MDKVTRPDTDQQLVEEFKGTSAEGRRRAMQGLYERHAGGLRYYLLRVTRSPHLADDLTQEAFLRALQSMDRFSGRSSFKTWIYSIATNLLKDHLRRPDVGNRAYLDAPGEVPSPGALAEQHEEVRRVREALDALPEDMRAAVVLVRLEGLKYREAAEALGIKLETLRMRVHRAYMALAASLKE